MTKLRSLRALTKALEALSQGPYLIYTCQMTSNHRAIPAMHHTRGQNEHYYHSPQPQSIALTHTKSFHRAMKFSWSQPPPRLVLTAEDSAFDPVTIQNWKDEGYEVSYLPFTSSRKEYVKALHRLADPLELGEKYAIVGRSGSFAMI